MRKGGYDEMKGGEGPPPHTWRKRRRWEGREGREGEEEGGKDELRESPSDVRPLRSDQWKQGPRRREHGPRSGRR